MVLNQRIVAFAIRIFSALSLRSQRRLGGVIGALAWRLGRAEAQTTKTNLALCFPGLAETRRDALARESLANTAMLLTEAGALYRWPAPRWQALTVTVEGAELLEAGLADPRGLLLLVPHLGNWEYLALVLGAHGLTALYDPPRVAGLEAYLRDARNRGGANLLPIDASGLRGLYRALQAGGLAAILPDQVPSRDAGVYAPFFGHSALTMTFAHRLIRRTGARVLMGTALRCPDGFRLRYLALDEAIRDPDPAVSATSMNRAIEALVREAPAQYQWDYKRFKRQPRGEADPYRRADGR